MKNIAKHPLRGLGRSEFSLRYGIADLAEAKAYLKHPVLGHRLMESFQAVLSVDRRSALEIFGTPDEMKLQSSASLFSLVDPRKPLFGESLARFFQERKCAGTMRLLRNER